MPREPRRGIHIRHSQYAREDFYRMMSATEHAIARTRIESREIAHVGALTSVFYMYNGLSRGASTVFGRSFGFAGLIRQCFPRARSREIPVLARISNQSFGFSPEGFLFPFGFRSHVCGIVTRCASRVCRAFFLGHRTPPWTVMGEYHAAERVPNGVEATVEPRQRG
jgi:hypothetical protein